MCAAAKKWATWPDPQWQPYRKHLPVKAGTPDHQVAEGTRHGPARYIRGVDNEELEMECVRRGIADRDNRYEIHNDHEYIAEFWMKCDQDIGWYKGEKTSYIVAEWQRNGDQNGVHGYPVTKAELRRRGAQL